MARKTASRRSSSPSTSFGTGAGPRHSSSLSAASAGGVPHGRTTSQPMNTPAHGSISPVQQSQPSGGFLSNMMGTVASGVASGVGFGVAQRAVDAVFGPRQTEIVHSTIPAAVPQAVVQPSYVTPHMQQQQSFGSNPCQMYLDDLNNCMARHTDMNLCQNYFDSLKSCQATCENPRM